MQTLHELWLYAQEMAWIAAIFASTYFIAKHLKD